jgi:hypothetical protein
MAEKTLKELIDLAKSQLGQADAMIDWSTRAAKDGLLVNVEGVKVALANAVRLTKEAYTMAIPLWLPIVFEDEKT